MFPLLKESLLALYGFLDRPIEPHGNLGLVHTLLDLMFAKQVFKNQTYNREMLIRY